MRMLGEIPERVNVAVSGGVDPMVLLDFLINGRRKINVLHYHHGTEHADDAFSFVKNVSESLGVGFISDELRDPVPEKRSKEDFWRERRYSFFDRAEKHGYPEPILLAHHLDDVLETWLFSSFHGTPKIVPYMRGNCFRPMLMAKKEEILEWAERNSVPYINDPSNENTGFMRNKIRHELVPKVLEVNPGIHKVLAKKVQEQYNSLIQLSG